MKKLLALLLIVALCCNFYATAKTDPGDTVLYGDPTLDNGVDAKDALLILKFAVGNAAFSGVQFAVSDVNGDTQADAKDALAVLKFAVGTNHQSSCGQPYTVTGNETLPDRGNPDFTEQAKENREIYQTVLGFVNQIRAEAGVAPLVLSDTLCQAATLRAMEMEQNGYFGHTRPDGSSCFTVFDEFSMDYRAAGENIAREHATPEAVVEAWKNSPGHYTNMIDPRYTKLGVGMSNMAIDAYGIYWVQLFMD